MPQNIEIKAKIDDPVRVHKIAASLADSDVEFIEQEDIFFNCDTGRLKLRFLSPTSGELIFYQRSNISGPKSSSYDIVKTDNPSHLRLVLAKAYGEKIIVRKTRHLFHVGRTRIHLDKVEDLGNYLELEVVLEDGDNLQDGENEAQKLMKLLNICSADLINVAYADLLLEKQL